nr:PQQ-dependent sugar dehydrogenase [Nocardia arizonensis]
MATTAFAALLCAAAMAGCSPGSQSRSPAGPATTTATTTATGVPGFGAGTAVAEGLRVPWGLAFLPDGAVLVAERDTGRILRVTPTGPAEQVYQVPGVIARGEGGLLGLALAPDYAESRYIYAYFTSNEDNRIARFRLDGATEPIFTGIAKAGNHNGGRIAFGPDGLLYVGTGDAGQSDRAQDPASPNGKILRLTPAGLPAADNPTTGSPVYSLGHRNVQGLAWDRAGRLFAAEFGQNRFDEINLIRPGANYGWPIVEGRGGADRGYAEPLLTWSTAEASPSGIAIAGDTLYVAALRGRRLWTARLSGEALGETDYRLRDTYGRLRTVAVAPDGALWLTTSNTDGRGDIRGGDDRVLRFPPL